MPSNRQSNIARITIPTNAESTGVGGPRGNGGLNPAEVYLSNLGTGSRRTMRQALDVMAQIAGGPADGVSTFPWGDLRYEHTAMIRATLLDRYAPSTCNKMLSALRSTLRQAWRLGLLTAEELASASDLAKVRGTTLRRGRLVDADDLSKVMAVCHRADTAAGSRDAAIVGMLFGLGLRRAELVQLDVADVGADGSVIVNGKGSRERMAYMPAGTARAVIHWLNTLGGVSGALFRPVSRSGRVLPRRLSASAVYEMLHRRAAQAGVKAFAPHDLRRSLVSSALDSGADLLAVQQTVGHANAATTRIYDLRGQRALRAVADMVVVPD
jgi:site-specific recombinase XerC